MNKGILIYLKNKQFNHPNECIHYLMNCGYSLLQAFTLTKGKYQYGKYHPIIDNFKYKGRITKLVGGDIYYIDIIYYKTKIGIIPLFNDESEEVIFYSSHIHPDTDIFKLKPKPFATLLHDHPLFKHYIVEIK